MPSPSRFEILTRPEPHVDGPWLVVTALAYAAVVVAATPACGAPGFDPWPMVLGLYVVSCGVMAWRAPRRWVAATAAHAPVALVGGMMAAGLYIAVRDYAVPCPPAPPAFQFCVGWSCERGHDRLLSTIFVPIFTMAVLAPVIGWPARLARQAVRRAAG